MADITRERTGELVQKLFQVLQEYPEGLPARVALERLANSVTLTEYEAGVYETTGQRRFEKIVRFATVDCVKAGWLLKNKGTWSLTDDGIFALKKFKEPRTLYVEAVRLYHVWKRGQKKELPTAQETTLEDSEETNEAFSVTFDQAEELAWAEIEQFLRGMNPYEFQQLVADLVKAMGYHISWVAPPGKDGGVDIIAHSDPLGTKPPRVKIQVKRVGDKITSDGLKSFIALVNGDDVGLYVSTGGFTRDAEEFARNQERRKITLINLEKFFDLWVEYFNKLDPGAQKRFPLTPIHFLTPST
jgi:restriction system protein